MGDKLAANLSPELMGLSILLSRLVAEVGYARNTSTHGVADWLAKLGADTFGDIDRVTIPGVSDEMSAKVKQQAKATAQFTLARCSFKPDA